MLFPDLKELIKLKTLANMPGFMQSRANNQMQGDYSSLFHGLGVEFETVRPYVIGDDVRYIDWRVTARIGEPQIKTFRSECDRNVLIIVDANAYMRFGTRGTFKSVQAAKTAALLAWKSLQQKDRVGGLIFGDVDKGIQFFKPAKNDQSVLRMLRILCNKQQNLHVNVPVSTALNHLAKVATPQTLIFIISDFSCDDMSALEKSILTLRKQCTLVLLPIHDPADRLIPPVGALIVANENASAIINTNDPIARNYYQTAWAIYKEKLMQLGKKINMPILWIETVVDPVKIFIKQESMQTWKT